MASYTKKDIKKQIKQIQALEISYYEFVSETEIKQAILNKAVRKTKWLNVMINDWIKSYKKDADVFVMHELTKELKSCETSHDIFKKINAIIDEVKNFIK